MSRRRARGGSQPVRSQVLVERYLTHPQRGDHGAMRRRDPRQAPRHHPAERSSPVRPCGVALPGLSPPEGRRPRRGRGESPWRESSGPACQGGVHAFTVQRPRLMATCAPPAFPPRDGAAESRLRYDKMNSIRGPSVTVPSVATTLALWLSSPPLPGPRTRWSGSSRQHHDLQPHAHAADMALPYRALHPAEGVAARPGPEGRSWAEHPRPVEGSAQPPSAGASPARQRLAPSASCPSGETAQTSSPRFLLR